MPVPASPIEPRAPRAAKARGRGLALGTFRSIWAAAEVEASPALRFLVARQRVEVNAADAKRLGLRHGEQMLVVDETGAQVHAEVTLRDATPAGTAFIERGIASDSATALRGGRIEIVPIPEPPLELEDELEVEEEALA